jgi:hypothetical protein
MVNCLQGILATALMQQDHRQIVQNCGIERLLIKQLPIDSLRFSEFAGCVVGIGESKPRGRIPRPCIDCYEIGQSRGADLAGAFHPCRCL